MTHSPPLTHLVRPRINVMVLTAILLLSASSQTMARQPADRAKQGGKDGRGLISQMNAFHTEVPAHPFDIVLVRPTSTSIAASVITSADTDGFIEFAIAGSDHFDRTPAESLKAGEPALLSLDGLKPDTAYSYRFRYRTFKAVERDTPGVDLPPFASSDLFSFHTPRNPGDTFTFTIQADSHLDAVMTPAVYERALANALADNPDFHIDLGDTFMTDKRREYKEALPQYIAQRYYFGQLCHSAPLFMVLGNHDGEAGYAARGAENIAAWSFAQRTRYFPAPEILSVEKPSMYTGRTSFANNQGANYYAFTWGDAQFIVLDPFWFTTSRPKGGGRGPSGEVPAQNVDTAATDENWARSLGRDQYDWLTRTLESSKSRFKFVFIHHLVGGLGKANRGGTESSIFFEWGGTNADGSPGFAQHRAGWPMPIHDLLVKNHVSAVFHGHDHLYVHAERDGIAYQCVAQPGNNLGSTRSAMEYGYKAGTILASPGHVRVHVAPESSTIEFVRASIGDQSRGRAAQSRERDGNGTVVDSYQINANK